MHKLTTDELGKRYNRVWVFRGLSFSVESGGSVAITGRNGSGKSTLLRMLSGLLRPSTGSVSLSFESQTLAPEEHIRSVGYVAPSLSFYRKLSAVENLHFIARMRGLESGAVAAEELLERVGLQGRGPDLVGSYSSGMLQRLRIASALLHGPPVLLLDEPFSNLDESGVELVRSVLFAHVAAGGIAVLATNSAVEADLCAAQVPIPENHRSSS